jgi:DNA-damage-inducible protein J
MAKTDLGVLVDEDVKNYAQLLFSRFGMDMTTAVNMFLHQAIRERGIPFDLHLDVPPSLDEAIEDGRLERNLSEPYATGEEAVRAMLED